MVQPAEGRCHHADEGFGLATTMQHAAIQMRRRCVSYAQGWGGG